MPPPGHAAARRGQRWLVDETCVTVAGRWSYLYRAVDQRGQVFDVLVLTRRDAAAAREFFTRALSFGCAPVEVTTDNAPVYPRVLEELVAAAGHVSEQYANNRVQADHGRFKARLRAMRGFKRVACAWTVSVRACVRAEPAPRPRRTDCRRCLPRSGPRRVRRTRNLPLTGQDAPNSDRHVRPSRTQKRLKYLYFKYCYFKPEGVA